jgi:hypothetical protein
MFRPIFVVVRVQLKNARTERRWQKLKSNKYVLDYKFQILCTIE